MNDPDQKIPKNKLVMPEGISAVDPVMDIQEAYVRSIMALPEVLQHILDELQDMNGNLGVLALYFEKKGLKDELFAEEDLQGEEDAGNAN
jgi:hypothetical protein